MPQGLNFKVRAFCGENFLKMTNDQSSLIKGKYSTCQKCLGVRGTRPRAGSLILHQAPWGTSSAVPCPTPFTNQEVSWMSFKFQNTLSTQYNLFMPDFCSKHPYQFETITLEISKQLSNKGKKKKKEGGVHCRSELVPDHFKVTE